MPDELKFNTLDRSELFERRRPYTIHAGVYFLWADDVIVYVGQSINIVQRVAGHCGAGNSWGVTHYSFIDVEPQDLDIIESIYIHKFKPKHNRRG